MLEISIFLPQMMRLNYMTDFFVIGYVVKYCVLFIVTPFESKLRQNLKHLTLHILLQSYLNREYKSQQFQS